MISFAEANAQPKRLQWDKRIALIESHFPEAHTRDWTVAFEDNLDLFAWMMQDILKTDQSEPGRDGPKPRLEMVTALPRFRQMMGDDFSMRPFKEAFTTIVGERSLSSVAAKTGISRSQVHRLLRGDCEPSTSEIEAIAKGFRKTPGHFVEYRLKIVLTALQSRLNEIPESSVKYFMQLVA